VRGDAERHRDRDDAGEEDDALEALDREGEIEQEDASQEEREGEDESHAASLANSGSQWRLTPPAPVRGAACLCHSGTVTLKHSLLALLVALIWGLNFVVIDEGLAGVPPLVFVAMRFVLVAIPAVFFIRPPAIGWRNIVAIGAFLSLGQFCLLYLALSVGMPAGLASLLLQTQVILTLVISALFLGEHPTRRQLVGVIVGTIGLGVVVVGHSVTAPWVPLVITLGAALSWAIGNVLSRRAKAASGLSLVVWSALVVPLPSFALALMVDGPDTVFGALSQLSLVAILSTVYTAIAASLIGYGIWNTLMARYPTSAVVPFTLLVPVIGIAAAWLVQGEVPTFSEILGGSVMLAGLATAVIRRGSTARRSLEVPGPGAGTESQRLEPVGEQVDDSLR
jgi:O-acetylserine/cysteine efflux transporter